MSNIFLTSYLTILVVFVAWMLISVKDKIFQKIIVLTALTFVTLFVSISFESYKGWPSNDLPSNARIISISIIPGSAIYAWMYPYPEDKIPTYWDKLVYHEDGKPRVYEIDYSPGKEKEWMEASNKLSKGYIVSFKTTKKLINKNGSLDEGAYDTPSLEIRSPEETLPKNKE